MSLLQQHHMALVYLGQGMVEHMYTPSLTLNDTILLGSVVSHQLLLLKARDYVALKEPCKPLSHPVVHSPY
jgi:hypothetical protein